MSENIEQYCKQLSRQYRNLVKKKNLNSKVSFGDMLPWSARVLTCCLKQDVSEVII